MIKSLTYRFKTWSKVTDHPQKVFAQRHQRLFMSQSFIYHLVYTYLPILQHDQDGTRSIFKRNLTGLSFLSRLVAIPSFKNPSLPNYVSVADETIVGNNWVIGTMWNVHSLVEVGWVLWHIHLCKLLLAESIFMQIISSISNNSV